MIPNFDLAKFNQQLDAWLALIQEAHQEPMDAEPRQLLQQAIAQVKRGQTMLNADYAKESAAFLAEMESVQRMNAETLAQVESVQKQLAEFKLPEAPAQELPVPVDPNLAQILRRELLDRYGPKTNDKSPRPALQDFSAEYHPAAGAEPSKALASASAASSLPDAVIAGLMQLAHVTSRDVVYHLGCGDGSVLISAASRFQAKGIGVEGDVTLAERARENVRKARLQARIEVKAADPRQEDCSRASVVVLSLGTQNEVVAARLRRQLKPGARVVSHEGSFQNWPADQKITVEAEGTTYHLHLRHIGQADSDSSIGGSQSLWGS